MALSKTAEEFLSVHGKTILKEQIWEKVHNIISHNSSQTVDDAGNATYELDDEEFDTLKSELVGYIFDLLGIKD